MKKLTILVAYDNDGNVFCARKEALGRDYNLQTDAEILDVFPEPKWYEITAHDPTFKLHSEIKRQSVVQDGMSFRYDASLEPLARMRSMIISLRRIDTDAKDEISGMDYENMPAIVALVIDRWLQDILYPSLAQTDFFTRWSKYAKP